MRRDFRRMTQLIQLLMAAGIDAVRQVSSNVKRRMAVEGKPIRYPVEWDSERQRRAFFATNGFGHGIPYRRTNRYRLGWKEEMQPYGVALHNESPAGAIGGIPSGWQSRIHRGRWPNLLVVLFDELKKVPTDISNRLKVVAGKV